MGECKEEADEDVQGQVGVVGGLGEGRAMDATLEIMCERCARSPGILADTGADSGQ